MADTQAVISSTGEDLEKVSRVRNLFNASKASRARRVEWWRRAYQVVHNRTWSPMREAWMPSPTASEVWPIVAALVGWMTDQRPMLYMTPAADPGSPIYEMASILARDLEKTMEANWNARKTTAEIEKMLWDAFVYGTGIFKTTWNGALEEGLGDGEIVRVDPFRFYPDPAAASMEDASYLIEAREMSLQELDRRYPGKADAVEAFMGSGNESLDQRPPFENQGRVPMANPAGLFGNAPRYGLVGQGGRGLTASQGFDRSVTVYESWVREHQVSTGTDDKGEPTVHVDDHWRVIVVAGNVVLMDEPALELFGHGRHPYTRHVNGDMGEFWGVSLVDHLTPLQLSMNRLLSAAQQHAELTGNPVLMEDSRSGIIRTQVVNRPGQRIQKNPGSDVQWLNPPPLSPVVTDMIRFYQTEMERVSGLSAIVRGMTPTGRNAQGVLDSIQEAAFVRVRSGLRNLELSLRESGTLLASLITENYTQPRIIAVTGSEDMTPLVLRARHFYVPGSPTTPGQPGAAGSAQEEPLKFSLWIQAGSSVPTSRGARAQEADLLFSMGGIDTKALLDAHDFPNRGEVLQRVAQQSAQGLLQPPGRRPQVPQGAPRAG